MKFKDVAHLYIGCKVSRINYISTLLGVEWNSEYPLTTADGDYFIYEEVEPILYPLSAMTDEQRLQVHSLKNEHLYTMSGRSVYLDNPNVFKWYLDNHFDLYNLIPQGEAIDVTTLESNPYRQ